MAINRTKKFTTKLIVFVIFSIFILIIIKRFRENQKQNLLHGKTLPGMKYILLWTREDTIPFLYLGQGRAGFISRECAYTNCIVTGNESLLGSTTAFHAVLFHGLELTKWNPPLPTQRSPHQKFVFASIEPPANYPLCEFNFDGYFNWTWTYKLESEVRWGYIVIKDAKGNIVGPNRDMHWIKWKDMAPVSAGIKHAIRGKDRAVAWINSKCITTSCREEHVDVLKFELESKYDLEIDIFGTCGHFTCDFEKSRHCEDMISKHYYFYLSFENSFSEDYVTETLLHAVQNNAVPIVYGGANYSRFLPERSYLDAREYNISELAQLIHHLIRKPELYAEFFRWKRYYSYHSTTKLGETNEYCKMCEILNNDKLMKTSSVYTKFDDFWDLSIQNILMKKS